MWRPLLIHWILTGATNQGDIPRRYSVIRNVIADRSEEFPQGETIYTTPFQNSLHAPKPFTTELVYKPSVTDVEQLRGGGVR